MPQLTQLFMTHGSASMHVQADDVATYLAAGWQVHGIRYSDAGEGLDTTSLILMVSPQDSIYVRAGSVAAYRAAGYRPVAILYDGLVIPDEGSNLAFLETTYHLSFDGVDDKIVIPASASLNNLPLGDFTIEASLKMDDAEFGIGIFHKADVVSFKGLEFFVSPNIAWKGFYLWLEGTAAGTVYSETGDVIDHETHHYEVVYVKDANTIYLFFDGVEQESNYSTIETLAPYDDSLYDVSIFGNTFFGKGSLNWLRVSNIARHTSNFTPPSLTVPPATDANTVLLLALDESTGTVAADTSGNGNDGVITGATWEEGS